MKERILTRRAIYVGIVISSGIIALLLVLLSAQERPIVVSTPPPELELARVLEGPDPNAIYLQLQAGEPEITEVSYEYEHWKKGEVSVRMEGFSSIMSPGDPMLPYQLYQIALPPDADPATLELQITQLVEEEIPGEYRVAPAPPHEPCQEPSEKEPPPESEKWGEGKNIFAGRNTFVYEEDALYPAEVSGVTYGGRLRKWKVATVAFYPVRYNPVEGMLFLTRQIDLKISFSRDSAYLKRPEVEPLLRDDVFDDRARELFLNFDRAKQWYQKPILEEVPEESNPGNKTDDSQPSDPNYAIITTEETFSSTATLTGTLDDFCFQKEELGFEVMVVTEHRVRTVEGDSITGYSFALLPGIDGYEDVTGAPAPDQRPDRVRKWLQDYYVPLGIEYVLLIGNPDPDNMEDGDLVGDLPMKDTQLHLFADVPTDFYFAELTGDWDLDDDGYAGEYYPPTGVSYGIPAAVAHGLFSARWEGVLEVIGAPDPVTLRLTIQTEGNTKVWLDQDDNGLTEADVIFEDMSVHWPQATYIYPELSNGHYQIKIEYAQTGGDAYCDVYPYSWTDGVTPTLKHDDGTGTYVNYLEADFFNNSSFGGAPTAEWDNRTVYLYYTTGDKGPGGVEFFADVIVGRIPCYDEDQNGSLDYAQLNDILSKTINFENAPVGANPWRVEVLASSPYVAAWDAAVGDYTVAKYEWAEMLRDGVAVPTVWDWYRIYEQTYPDVVPDAEVHDGCTPTKTEAAWNDPTDPDDGRGVVMWMTHGDQTSARKVFANDQCAVLDNTKPSVVGLQQRPARV
jgi:hypothetical protein